MPRYVRPAWLEASADGRASPVGLGPRRRDGWLRGHITLRTADGSVSDAVTFYAGGQDGPGRGRLELDIPGTLEIVTEAWGNPDHPTRTTVLIRPREA